MRKIFTTIKEFIVSLASELQKYGAETLGTFFLTFAVMVSTGANVPLPVPIVASLTLAIFVYTIGSISGTHINPAISAELRQWNVCASRDHNGER